MSFIFKSLTLSNSCFHQKSLTKSILCTFVLSSALLSSGQAFANAYYSIGVGGLWSAPSTWNGTGCGGASANGPVAAPLGGDSLTICNGAIVTVGAASVGTSVTVNTGGMLKLTTHTLTLTGALTNNGGTVFSAGGAATHALPYLVNTAGTMDLTGATTTWIIDATLTGGTLTLPPTLTTVRGNLTHTGGTLNLPATPITVGGQTMGTSAITNPVYATKYYSVGVGGLWSAPSTWNGTGCGGASTSGPIAAPLGEDSLTICDGAIVTVGAVSVGKNTTVNPGGMLKLTTHTLTLTGALTNNGGTVFSAGGAATHALPYLINTAGTMDLTGATTTWIIDATLTGGALILPPTLTAVRGSLVHSGGTLTLPATPITVGGRSTASISSSSAYAPKYYSIGVGGLWSAPSTWNGTGCGGASTDGPLAAPLGGDSLTICNGSIVTVGAASVGTSVTVNPGGMLKLTTHTLTLTGALTNNGGTVFSAGGAATHALPYLVNTAGTMDLTGATTTWIIDATLTGGTLTLPPTLTTVRGNLTHTGGTLNLPATPITVGGRTTSTATGPGVTNLAFNVYRCANYSDLSGLAGCQITTEQNPIYGLGRKLKVTLNNQVANNRFEHKDLWVAIQKPQGELLFMSSQPFNRFKSFQPPYYHGEVFMSDAEFSNREDTVLEFDVPVGVSGKYTLYGVYVTSGKNPLLDTAASWASNLATKEITLE